MQWLCCRSYFLISKYNTYGGSVFLFLKGKVSPDSAEAVDANKMIKLFEVTKAVMEVNPFLSFFVLRLLIKYSSVGLLDSVSCCRSLLTEVA